jgi:O-antigen ligase
MIPGSIATILSVLCIATLYSGLAYFRWPANENLGHAVNNILHPRYIYTICGLFAIISLLSPNINFRSSRIPKLFVWACLSFSALLILQFLLTPDSSALWLSYRVEFMVMTPVFMIVLGSAARPTYVFDALRIIVVLQCALNVFLFIRPSSFPLLALSGRPSGLWGNPNVAAFFIAGAMPLITLGVKPWVRAGLYAVTLAGVVATLSRGGLLVWVVLFFTSAFLRPERANVNNLAERTVYAAGIGVATLLGSALASLDVLGWLARLSPAPVARLSSVNDFSVYERLYVLQLSLSKFRQKPIFGSGVGYTNGDWGYSMSTHNMFMLILVEHGIVGMCVLLFWLLSLFSFPSVFGLWAFAYFVTAGLSTHNFFQAEYGLQIALYWLAGHVFGPTEQPHTAE